MVQFLTSWYHSFFFNVCVLNGLASIQTVIPSVILICFIKDLLLLLLIMCRCAHGSAGAPRRPETLHLSDLGEQVVLNHRVWVGAGDQSQVHLSSS